MSPVVSQSASKLVKAIRAARCACCPIVAVNSADPANAIQTVNATVNGKHHKFQWDLVEGTRGFSEEAVQWLRSKGIAPGEDATVMNPVGFLQLCQAMPAGAVSHMHMAHRQMKDSAAVVQAIWNIRDLFKFNGRTLVLHGTGIVCPPELQGDMLVVDQELPAPAELAMIADELITSAELPAQNMDRIVEAIQGLPAFAAEQALAMSATREGINLDDLWERKRKAIEQSPCLRVFRNGEQFSDIGGCDSIKRFMKLLCEGPLRPNCVVFIDEIEKAIAGQGDTSGVSQDQLGVLLTYMQDHAADGCIFVGAPGTSKSATAKAIGNEAGCPTVQLDLGAAKGSLVGQSETQIRQAMEVITSISNGKSLWIATCNSIGNLPPELRRRFTLGTYYFDTPTAEEREAIWVIYEGKYQVSGERPACDGWTGAEIKTCCRLASVLGVSLVDASQYVVPVSQSAPDVIERLRSQADGRFLSASSQGVYRRRTETQAVAKSPKVRKILSE